MKLISTIFILLITLNLYAQQKIKTEAGAEIVEYSNKDGLPTTDFSDIVQTKDGYIWISGIEGTNRFDGYQFEDVGQKYGFPGAQATFYDSTNNVLYFASPSKFAIFKNGEFKVFSKNDGYRINGLDGQVVNFVYKDSKSRIWIGSSTPFIDKKFNGGLTKYENGQFTVYDSTTFPLHNARSVFETPYGDLIFTSSGRNTRTFEEAYIALFKDNKFTRIDKSKGFDLVNASLNPFLYRSIVDNKGNTWIAFNGVIHLGDQMAVMKSGILMYDGGQFHQFPGLEDYYTPNSRGIARVYFSQGRDKVYASLYSPDAIKFLGGKNIIYELKDDRWIKSGLMNEISKFADSYISKQKDDFYYFGISFYPKQRLFPEMASIDVTDFENPQGTMNANQFYDISSNKIKKVDAFTGFPLMNLDAGLLVRTFNGIGFYYPKSYMVFDDNAGFLLPNAFIPELDADKNGIVWISFSISDLPGYYAINNVGMNIWDGKKLLTVTEKDGLSSNITYQAYQDSKDRVWIATSKGVTLSREFKNAKGEWVFKFNKIPNSIPGDYNTGRVIETTNGDIYAWQTTVGDLTTLKTNFYLGKYDGEKFVEMPCPFDKGLTSKKYQFYDLREGINSQLMLYGLFDDERKGLVTAKTHIMYLQKDKWINAPKEWKMPNEQLHYVGKLGNKIYYLTTDGFYQFDGSKFINLIDSVTAHADFTILKGASVAGTKTDNQADGKLFIRLRNRGLVIFDGENLNYYTKKDGLPSANLYNPTPDRKGNMIFSHPTGALIVKDNKFHTFYDVDLDISGGSNVATLDGNGNLVMHYKGLGLVIEKEDHRTYPLHLTSVSIDTSTYYYEYPKDLSHAENSIIFNFSALNFSDPKQTIYQYILEGYDNKWSRSSNLSFAQYQNLPPGKYSFRVKGITSNGVQTNEVKYAFVITPPFWKTWWAYTFYIFSFFGLLYIIRKAELKRQRKNSEIKESKLRAEAAEFQAKAAEAQSRVIQAENERKTEELEEARQLQLSMLPNEIPSLPHLDISVYMKTATEVGGDYYDFSIKEDDSLNICLGDATGHGMKAGTIVSMMKSLFTANSIDKSLEDFFITSNYALKNSKLDKMMMAFAMININSNKLNIANAGIPPIYIYRRSKNIVEEINLNGLPIGAMKNSEYDIYEGELTEGDTILMLSDGFPELRNNENEMFGYERLKKVFANSANKSSEEIISILKEEGSSWVNDKDPDDDVSFVVIKVK